MSPAQLEQLDSLDLVHVFARCCDNHEKLSTTLVDIVKILRDRRFYMTTCHEASAVRDLIKSANQKKADTIQRYVSSLVKCLRMPPHVFKSMPSISITHLKLPNVKWYGVGDDVDMYISAAWSHAIVIETKDVVATNVNDVRIQYVGHPKGRKNPTWVNKAHLREHFPDTAVVGPDDTFSAASIKEDLRCKIQEIHKSPGQRSSSPSYRLESSSDGAADDQLAAKRQRFRAVMPSALLFSSTPPPLPPPSLSNSHSSRIVSLTSCIKLFELRNVNLGLRIVRKVRQTIKIPEGPEPYLEVLNWTGKIRFSISFQLTFLNRV